MFFWGGGCVFLNQNTNLNFEFKSFLNLDGNLFFFNGGGELFPLHLMTYGSWRLRDANSTNSKKLPPHGNI